MKKHIAYALANKAQYQIKINSEHDAFALIIPAYTRVRMSTVEKLKKELSLVYVSGYALAERTMIGGYAYVFPEYAHLYGV